MSEPDGNTAAERNQSGWTMDEEKEHNQECELVVREWMGSDDTLNELYDELPLSVKLKFLKFCLRSYEYMRDDFIHHASQLDHVRDEATDRIQNRKDGNP